jgi:phosphoribosyl-dephospho-CoA transferase
MEQAAMSALQRHTLCWLESAELRLIARQLNGAFSALPASLREERGTICSPDISPASCAGASVMKRVFPWDFAFRSAGKGSVYGWRRLLHYRPSRACQRRNKRPSCLPSAVPARYVPLAPCVRRGGPETGLGVWGSVALEMTTPWLWTDSRSDLDIRITPWHEMALSDCYSVLTDIAQQYSVRIDGEINLPNGFSINIKEWFSRSLTLLAKGETDVELMTRQDVDGLIKHLSMKYIKGN